MFYQKAKAQIFKYESKKEYYWVLGDDKKPPLVILEGFTSDHRDFLKLANLLKNDFFVIIPDLPGWGYSQKLPSNTIQSYAKYLNCLRKHLKLPKIQIVAHCIGTSIALSYTLNHPNGVTKLFLISTPFEENTLSKDFFQHLAKTSSKFPNFFRPMFYFWRSRLIDIPIIFFMLRYRSWNKRWRTIKYDFWIQSFEDEEVVEENWSSYINFNFNRVTTIKIPIHLIHGAEDIIINKNQAEKFRQLLRNVTLDIIPKAGHLPPTEVPGHVARIILKY